MSDWTMAGETLLPGEVWWGGAVADGTRMPFGDRPHRRDLGSNAGAVDDPGSGANQSAPVLVSSAGRYVWSERPFEFTFGSSPSGERRTLTLRGEAELVLGQAAEADLGAAFRAVSSTYFPASGRTPARAMFTGPQWNTWIEMPYLPTQEAVLGYARGVLATGFPPGVLMIDDRWSADYGDWTFDRSRFPDPAAMTAELHELGFAVMLWLVPFVSPDSAASRSLDARGLLVTGRDGRPVVREWWNGWSTMLDLGRSEALDWLREALHRLQTDHDIDGFKFDAGDLRDWRPGDVSASGGGAVDHCAAWARLAGEFAFNELRACWGEGGRPLAQRLHDKPPTWGSDGLGSLIPEGIAQGLIGHPYGCPDMIGGGDVAAFADGVEVDQELFVRFAQCSALFPMMQFSLAPWRVLDAEHLAAVKAAVALRQSLLPELSALIDHAAATGEPILRPLAYHVAGGEQVRDQFLLGPDLLVSPVLERGASTRRVVLPPGRWQAVSGDDAGPVPEGPVLEGPVLEGPATVDVPVGLDSLPLFRRLSGQMRRSAEQRHSGW